ncbi:hypothetical protein CEXT_313701 [Caerostris extrusa]|uniref:Uncharacterized protein n=1 Tax=Caerostris extrusa TaxID=172846 RepID=A0AAV4N175_CAEEX|nr:hypothetical protein CEXT_313701 [Caerostris extrusa]
MKTLDQCIKAQHANFGSVKINPPLRQRMAKEHKLMRTLLLRKHHLLCSNGSIGADNYNIVAGEHRPELKLSEIWT